MFLAALKKGIRPATRFNSHKVVLPNGTTQGWYVKNDTPVYEGYKPLDYALAKSDNTIFAQLTLAVGPQPVADAAHAAGINSPLNPNLSIGLGGLTLGVTPLEMAHAYATIANEGERVGGSILFHTPDAGITQSDAEPISILRVVHPGGHADENTPLPRQVIARNDALTLIDAMRGVVRYGTGTKAALPRRTVIGKTGTTSNFLDAWFIGAVPQRVTAVWVGYPDVARPMLTQYHGHEVLGGTYPAQVWHDFMASVTEHMPVRDWPHAEFVSDESGDRRQGDRQARARRLHEHDGADRRGRQGPGPRVVVPRDAVHGPRPLRPRREAGREAGLRQRPRVRARPAACAARPARRLGDRPDARPVHPRRQQDARARDDRRRRAAGLRARRVEPQDPPDHDRRGDRAAPHRALPDRADRQERRIRPAGRDRRAPGSGRRARSRRRAPSSPSRWSATWRPWSCRT